MFAMNCGWMFQIPLQHRLGCGYAFNEKYISIENAIKEIEEYIDREVIVQKIFDFNLPNITPYYRLVCT